VLEEHAPAYLADVEHYGMLAANFATALDELPISFDMPIQATPGKLKLTFTGDPEDPSIPGLVDIWQAWQRDWPPPTRARLQEIQRVTRLQWQQLMIPYATWRHWADTAGPSAPYEPLATELASALALVYEMLRWWERDVGNFRRRRTRTGQA
jgi:hypothetical protein